MNTLAKSRVLHAAYPACRGLTLIEILIALLVMSIGLLGLAGLQTVSLKFNTSAYYRTQATALSYDLADRMRANRTAALANEYNVVFADPVPGCGTAATTGTRAAQDLSAWLNTLACRLPLSTGAVVRNGDEFTFTVRWDDSQGAAPATDFGFTTVL